MNRGRVLVVSPFTPAADADHGAGRVLAGWLSEMATRRPVALVHVAEPDDAPLADALVDRLDVVHRIVRPRVAPGRARLVGGLLQGRPLWVQAWPMRQVTAIVDDVRERWHPDVVQCELEVTAGVLHGVAPERRMLVVHDPPVAAALDRARRADSPGVAVREVLDATAWWRHQRKVLRVADAVVAFSSVDARAVSRLVGGRRVDVVPFGVDTAPIGLGPVRDAGIVFVGGPGHSPNVAAVRRLLTRILPLVRQAVPDAALTLVGGWADTDLPDGPGEGVCRPGRIDDVAALLARAQVVVAPVDDGGGMRVKVVEALAAGAPLVATGRALQGVEDAGPGLDSVVVRAETDADIADAVVRLLRSPGDGARLGVAGQRWAAEWLTWGRCADRFESVYARFDGTAA